MTDFWTNVYSLFGEAIELDPAIGRSLVEARTEGQPDLRKAVMDLLDAHNSSGDFLAKPAGARPAETPRPIEPGVIAGAWRLIEKIGEGGMGEVYRAERADGAFNQQAAVKLTRISLFDRDADRRFRAERDILATLRHSNIVSLLDGGALPSGQAWLAMELVEGESIAKWAASRCTNLNGRLRLFQQVCAAVQHAHRHGVVHRDLKPANILVTGEGMVKVVDFGVAKLLAPEGAPEPIQTGRHPAPLTPNYASPEQLRGLPATTASDGYALGVILYEMLAASKPYETTGKPFDEVLAIVTEREPGRPSEVHTAAGPAGKHWPRKSDLDAIVLKAMAKAPERRYASAEELSEDISRYLDGQPIVAREPSLWYLAARMARRHALAHSAFGLALLAIVGGLGIAVWQQRAAERARRRAEERLADVRQLANTMIFKIHDAVEPLPGSTAVRRTIVESGLAYLERIARETGDDAALRLELAGGYARIGRAQGDPQRPNLGDRKGAEASFRRSIGLLEPLCGHPNSKVRDSALDAIAGSLTLLSNVLKVQGRQIEAIEAARRSLAAVEELSRVRSGDANVRRRIGSAHFSLALAMQGAPEAVAEWNKSGTVFEALLAEQPDSLDRMRNVALVAKYLAVEYEGQARPEEARKQYERALAIDERRLALAPSDWAAAMDLSNDLSSLAALHNQERRFVEAAELLERGLALRQKLADKDPNDVLTRSKVGHIEWRLAQNALMAGRVPQARTAADRAVDTMTTVLARTRDAVALRDYAAALTFRGLTALRQGERATACQAAARAQSAVDELARSGGALQWPALEKDLPRLQADCRTP